jgi:ubiquinol-cytochrome c reductase cytochrome c subunit
MPVFSPEVLDDHDLDSMIRYLLFLRDRPQPGGIQLGRSGPVTEGLVAWFVGLGLMLVMAYFIGERREPDGTTDEVVPSIEQEESKRDDDREDEG